jgi:hypothetical protein
MLRTSQLDPEERSSNRRWWSCPVAQDFLGEHLLLPFEFPLAGEVAGNQRDRLSGALRRRRKGGDHAGPNFEHAKVDWKQAVGRGVGDDYLLSLQRERAAEGCDQAGLAYSSGQRKDGQKPSPRVACPQRLHGGQLQAGMFDQVLEREPSCRDAFP